MDLRTVRIISTAVFICVGTAGNILSVITVSNKHCKKSSYTVYLTGLAIADLLALYTITTVIHAQQETFGINPIATNSLSCKLHLFLANLFSGVSIWLIVALALERAFSVYYPFKVKSVCKPKTAFIIMAMIVAFFIAFNAHFVYGMQLQSGVSPNNDTLKPSLNTNASTNYGENENHAAILPPFEESVSGCFSNNNNHDDDDDDDDDNSSIIDEISGPENEITTNDPMVIGEASDTTDHPLAITAGCNSTETNTPDLPLAFTCHSTKTKSGNHSISSNGCRQFPNKTSGNQTGDCQPADLNCNHIKSTLRNHDNANLVTTVCGFADQGYVDFYRVWVIIDSFFYFLLPVLVLVTANTATWIKVYRSTRKSPTSEKALAIRRTRHVLILTSLISAGFITFAGPATVIFIIEAILADDPQYVLYNGETLAVLQFIGECLFLCNHTFNFFLYILSGKGFRNSLKAAFCKYEG